MGKLKEKIQDLKDMIKANGGATVNLKETLGRNIDKNERETGRKIEALQSLMTKQLVSVNKD